MGVFLAWMTAAGLQTVRDLRAKKMPRPSEYLASGAVFGLLSVVGSSSEEAGKLAGVAAWGLLIALAYRAGGPAALAGGKPAPGTAPPVGAASRVGG